MYTSSCTAGGRGALQPTPPNLVIRQVFLSGALQEKKCVFAMVHFKNRYMVMEVFIDAVKYVNPVTKLCIIRVSREDHQKVWAAITMVRCIGKIPVSFNLLDMSGSIRACKKAALECDEAKFEQYKLAAGDRVTPEIIQSVQSCFEKIRGLES
ncbi:probable ribonuclease P/MRP protein subunit POP5 isoform X3 [Panicum hallii]|uniref:probable ribonuclease P/MRP protein subunit POP5 isoform X3 n=1 Tax=Panicum hallii TaxID=206008 RepID=UPI000DF4D474|nr:probable ribonuclease P/MRP protein subunit POP5 isoform X3 [Panicum hallii]